MTAPAAVRRLRGLVRGNLVHRSYTSASFVKTVRRSLAAELNAISLDAGQRDFLRTVLDLSDREFLVVLCSLSHPNPTRVDCPPTLALVDLARADVPDGHPTLPHVVRCFPCATDVQLLRAELRRRQALIMAPAGPN